MKLHGKRLGLATATGLAGVVLAVLVLAGGSSRATTHGTNGLIVYQNRSDEQGTGTLYAVRPDGSGRRAITSAPGDAAPDWTPDGSKIAFSLGHTDGPLFCSVVLVNADGTGLTDLSTGQSGCEGGPAFTPDGQRIVFIHFDDKADRENIWTMDPPAATAAGSRTATTAARRTRTSRRTAAGSRSCAIGRTPRRRCSGCAPTARTSGG